MSCCVVSYRSSPSCCLVKPRAYISVADHPIRHAYRPTGAYRVYWLLTPYFYWHAACPLYWVFVKIFCSCMPLLCVCSTTNNKDTCVCQYCSAYVCLSAVCAELRFSMQLRSHVRAFEKAKWVGGAAESRSTCGFIFDLWPVAICCI